VRRPHGFADELRAGLTGPTGSWGTLTLLREARQPHFTPTEVRMVGSLAATLADGVRRAMLVDAAPGAGPTDTGVLVLAADDTVTLANGAANEWIDELAPHRGPNDARLPVAVRAVAAQTRRIAAGESHHVASARVDTQAGRWLVVRGSLVGPDQVAILLEPARPADLAKVITETYGFTPRERLVTQLVARGLSTAEIARRLHVSAYTVQDHLRAIFDKVRHQLTGPAGLPPVPRHLTGAEGRSNVL
jgi:DNA-binding NarL/FixJ family response regulator